MLLSQNEYEHLLSLGLKFTLIGNYEKKSGARIGVFLQRFSTNEPHCASDRIRGEWVVKATKEMELWRTDGKYDAVIFHIACDQLFAAKGKRFLDICDPLWKLDKIYLKAFEEVDGIIASTEELKEEIQQLTKTPVFVVGDGHDMEHYATKLTNHHTKKAKTVVWFGYAENVASLLPLLPVIKKHGLILKTISQRKPCDSEFVKWDVKTYIKEISECDFAVLPKGAHYKSDNKEITAYLSGIPVAKTAEDIARLIDPKERQKAMKRDLSHYTAKHRALEYLSIIKETRGKITPYTAILGGYEQPRTDVPVFTNEVNKFFDYVMAAKIYKVLPHRFIDSEISLWIDGNIFLTEPRSTYVELLGDADMVVFKHPWRNCLYDEAEPAKKRVPDDQKGVIDEQIAQYRREGMPKDFGLWECGMLLRRHNERTARFNEMWWAEICRFSRRDQLSFPYVVWKLKGQIKIKVLEGNVRQHKLFEYKQR